MSTNEHDHDTENVTPIKTPRQLITAVVLGFIVPVIIIVLLALFVASGKKPGHGSDALSAESIEQRIRPLAGFELRDASAPTVLRVGEEVFKGQCAACHTTGAAGAPKVGDNGAWAPRLGKGFDTLVAHVIKGFGAMPAQGGGEYNDTELARAVAWLGNQSGGKFQEPAAPAAQAGAPAEGGQAGAAPAAGQAAAAPSAQQPGQSGMAGTAAAAAAAPAIAAAPANVAPTTAAPAASAPATSGMQVAAAAAGGAAGKAFYESACVACHGAGVAGAPKFGDKAVWAPRIKEGLPHLYEAAIKGKGIMPAKGGRADASDADVKAAVDYMVAAAK